MQVIVIVVDWTFSGQRLNVPRRVGTCENTPDNEKNYRRNNNSKGTAVWWWCTRVGGRAKTNILVYNTTL